MTNSRSIAVRAGGLTKRFGGLTAVDHLDLEVGQGEAFALVGPDGAGKTTVMRMLCGIMDPDGGWSEVLGFDPVISSEGLKEQIGYMPQRFGLYDDLTVGENIQFYADIYGVSKAERQARLPELLSFSNLAPFQDRLAANLSGGMRQKLGLVCALIHTPRVLFLDEPTFGVDPVSRREFWEILYQLLGTGMSIILTTGYMDEAERAHRVGLMHRGRLLVADTLQNLQTGFEGELLEVLVSDQQRARRLLQDHPLVHQVLARGDRLMVTVKQAQEALVGLTEVLLGASLGEVHLSPSEPGLEDIFVQLVAREEDHGR